MKILIPTRSELIQYALIVPFVGAAAMLFLFANTTSNDMHANLAVFIGLPLVLIGMVKALNRFNS